MVANFHREGWDHSVSKEPFQQTRRHVFRVAERGYGQNYCVDFNYGMHHFARLRYAKRKYDKYLGRVSFRYYEPSRC